MLCISRPAERSTVNVGQNRQGRYTGLCPVINTYYTLKSQPLLECTFCLFLAVLGIEPMPLQLVGIELFIVKPLFQTPVCSLSIPFPAVTGTHLLSKAHVSTLTCPGTLGGILPLKIHPATVSLCCAPQKPACPPKVPLESFH